MPPPTLILIIPPLLNARPGFDYSLAGIAAVASGGTPAYAYSISGGPAGLTIDANSGLLSGVITSPSGAYSIIFSVVDSGAQSATVTVPVFVDSIVNGFDILARLPIKDQPGCTMTQLNLIAASMLLLISDMASIPFPASGSNALPAFSGEVLNRNQYSALAFPRWRPIVQITGAHQAGGGALRIGTVEDLITGKADIALDNSNRAVRFWSCQRWDGPSFAVIDYTAGFNVLPADLYEVFCELSILAYKEKDRSGLKQLRLGDGTTSYDKTLPQFIYPILERYTRVGQMI